MIWKLEFKDMGENHPLYNVEDTAVAPTHATAYARLLNRNFDELRNYSGVMISDHITESAEAEEY